MDLAILAAIVTIGAVSVIWVLTRRGGG